MAVDGAGPRDEGSLVRRGVQPHRAVVGAGQHVALPEGAEGQRAHGRREDVQVRLERSRIGSVVGGLNDEDDGRDDNGDGFQIQAWPKPINYWTFGTGEMIVANDKFVVQENELNGYKFQLVLVIKKLEKVQEIV